MGFETYLKLSSPNPRMAANIWSASRSLPKGQLRHNALHLLQHLKAFLISQWPMWWMVNQHWWNWPTLAALAPTGFDTSLTATTVFLFPMINNWEQTILKLWTDFWYSTPEKSKKIHSHRQDSWAKIFRPCPSSGRQRCPASDRASSRAGSSLLSSEGKRTQPGLHPYLPCPSEGSGMKFPIITCSSKYLDLLAELPCRFWRRADDDEPCFRDIKAHAACRSWQQSSSWSKKRVLHCYTGSITYPSL